VYAFAGANGRKYKLNRPSEGCAKAHKSLLFAVNVTVLFLVLAAHFLSLDLLQRSEREGTIVNRHCTDVFPIQNERHTQRCGVL